MTALKPKNKVYRFTPGDEHCGMRLDQFVPEQSEDLSRTLFRKIVDIGGVHVGGRRVRKCSLAVKAGEQIEVYLDGRALEPFVLGEEHILYRDKDLLAVSKPAGIESQPTPSRYRGTLYDALIRHLQNPARPHLKPSLGMVQRLDRDTSGVMVFSIHQRAHRALTHHFNSRSVQKRYLALVAGKVQAQEGEFRSFLARNRASNLVKSVEHGGKQAITIFRCIQTLPDATLVQVEILTGRSHQIRAHFSEAGHPLLGDVRYGGPSEVRGLAIQRQMLHSWQLELTHPVSKVPMNLTAPVPADMECVLRHLKDDFDFSGFHITKDNTAC